MTDNYSDHPKSIAEIRSDATQDAKDWTPRDVLIDLLRQIDGGELKPDALLVVYSKPDEIRPGFSLSSPSITHTIAMVANFTFDLHLRHRDI